MKHAHTMPISLSTPKFDSFQQGDALLVFQMRARAICVHDEVTLTIRKRTGGDSQVVVITDACKWVPNLLGVEF